MSVHISTVKFVQDNENRQSGQIEKSKTKKPYIPKYLNSENVMDIGQLPHRQLYHISYSFTCSDATAENTNSIQRTTSEYFKEVHSKKLLGIHE